MDTISHSWTNSFRGSFSGNSSNADNTQNKTIAILHHNSYFSLHNLDTPIFEKALIFEETPNCNNDRFSESPDSKSWYIKEIPFLSYHLAIIQVCLVKVPI